MRTARWLTALLMFTSFSASAQAADVNLLRPLGEDTRDSSAGGFVSLPDESALFVADDGDHGSELWRTDGTAAGTVMVVDLVPGPEGSVVRGLSVVDGVAYFAAGERDTQLWRSDGTAAGTRKLATLPRWEREVGFRPFGKGEVAVGVGKYAGGLDFYATDGTAAGTRKLDVVPAQEGRVPERWETAGGYLYFDFDHDLWRSDGTRAGTVRIEDARSAVRLLVVGDHLVTVGPQLAAVAPGESKGTPIFWKDGYQEPEASWNAESIDGRLYFHTRWGFMSWAPGEAQPTAIDETPSQAISSGSVDGSAEIVRSGERLFWSAGTSRLGGAALQTKGPDGVKQIGEDLKDPEDFFSLGDGRVLFAAENLRTNAVLPTLWISDGTEAGTREITARPYWWASELIRTRNGVVGPWSSPETGSELFRLDAGFTRVDLLRDINRRTVGSEPAEAARVGDRVVFKTHEQQALWVTDGSFDGTSRLLERDSGGRPLDPVGIASDDELAMFAARDGIYRTDGTSGGTRRIVDLGAWPESFSPLARLGDVTVFTARPESQDADTNDLWSTDGTAAGTQRLTTGADLRGATVALGRTGTMLVPGWTELWASDGTAAGTRQLFSDALQWPGTPEAIEVDNGFLASVGDAARGSELWHLDPTGRNPRLVKDIVPGEVGSTPRYFNRVGNRVLFAALGDDWSLPQWHSMDLATEQIEPMRWLEGWFDYDSPTTTAGGVTYLTTYSGDSVFLYRTDGTPAGTHLLHRYDGYALDAPAGFTHLDGVTYFTAEDEQHGHELWHTDGTPAGTRLVRDIVPGPESSYPSDFVATERFLFFTAYDERYGFEPWRILAAEPSGDGPVREPKPIPLPQWEAPPPVAQPPVAAPSKRLPPATKAIFTAQVRKLRSAKGAQRWRVTGTLSGSTCAGRAQVVLGRRTRVLKRVNVPLRRCTFSAVISSRTTGSGRWLQVRQGSVRSTKIRVR